VPVASVVKEIEPLGGAKLKPEQQKRVDQVATYVQHVYHLSQYAAIRSLSPSQVTIQEVANICDRLHALVADDIIKSKLDDSPQPTLFRTLTRKYGLGVGVNERYLDDAYYPLVVRSMSGLLTRTMDRLGNRTEISKLVIDFRRVLREHHKNLIERRPADPADSALWSFAADQPYILYATQRTIFALLEYAEFLDKMDEFEQQEDSDEVLEASITSLLSQSLIDNLLGKAIKQIVSIAKQTGRASAQEQIALPMPKANWAAEVVRDWLIKLAQDFETSNFDAFLRQKAEGLVILRDWAATWKPDKKNGAIKVVRDPKKPTDDQKVAALRADFESFLASYGCADITMDTAHRLTPHLLAELFGTEITTKSPSRWKKALPEVPWVNLLNNATSVKALVFHSENRPENATS
jgi:hypothetical protein